MTNSVSDIVKRISHVHGFEATDSSHGRVAGSRSLGITFRHGRNKGIGFLNGCVEILDECIDIAFD